MEFKKFKKKFMTVTLSTAMISHMKRSMEKKKVYEMISRNPDISTLSELQAKTPDSVVLIMHDEKNEKILLNKEFRLALGDWVYNFPAGLIDEGEEPIESARRELKEETGLDLLTVNDILPLSYSAIGFANETNLCIVGVADGTFSKSSSTVEEIKAGWYKKRRSQKTSENGIIRRKNAILLLLVE